MSVRPLRKIGKASDMNTLNSILVDIQENFNILGRQAPELIQANPSAGVINFLVKEADGTWHQWRLLAGAGVGLTQDNVNRTLTIHAP